MQERIAAKKAATAKAAGINRKASLPIPDAPERPTASRYASILVCEPTLNKTSGWVSSTSHWSYKIVINAESYVIRRFRDLVALEARMHADALGNIMPPFPEKHRARAVEEGTTVQTAEFAQVRADDMTSYLNDLNSHPALSHTKALNTFLTLADDLGTAWTEVSSSAITRMAAAVDVDLKHNLKLFSVGDITDDDPKLSRLASQETERMHVVLQAVPKVENCVVLFRELAEGAGNVGMEM